ncbi:hypothetical protein EVG20_g11622, partial [Dentipellis fragilis]
MPLPHPVTWILRLCFVIYTLISVLYTSGYLLICPFVRDCPFSGSRIPQWGPDRITATWTALVHGDSLNAQLSDVPLDAVLADTFDSPFDAALPESHILDGHGGLVSKLDALSSGSSLFWPSSDNTSTTHQMSESLFLSKAFANSMQPMKTIPFFYRASTSFDPDDITITTLITP